MAGNPELFDAFIAWYGDRPAALALVRALSHSACRCGSGGHPRRCEVHPRAYDAHLDELARESAADEELDRLREIERLARAHMDEPHCEINDCDDLCRSCASARKLRAALEGKP